MASTSPAWASLVTRRTPASPRATRSAKKVFQACLVSPVATLSPRTSRCPSALTPVAMSTAALTTRPPSRTFIVNASAATNVNGPRGLLEGAVAEVLDDLVQIGRHPRDLGLGQRVDPELAHELVHPSGGHAGEVAVGDHGDQRRLRPLAALEEPLGKVAPAAQLRDGDIDCPDAGVQVPVAIPVALRRA